MKGMSHKLKRIQKKIIRMSRKENLEQVNHNQVKNNGMVLTPLVSFKNGLST